MKDRGGIPLDERARSRGPGPISHDLILNLHTRRVTTEHEPTIAKLSWVRVRLTAEVKKTYAEVTRLHPYPAGTALEKALATKEVTEAAGRFSLRRHLEVDYHVLYSRWSDDAPHGFSTRVRLTERLQEPTAFEESSFTAASGLDPNA